MIQVVDYYSPKGKEFMDCLALNGVAGIARYLTNSPTDKRQTTPLEVRYAQAAGLSVYFFYEMDPTKASYFTFAQGAEDCRQAVERLRELGAPQGTVVYFAVDTNIDPVLCDLYFSGVESMVTPQIVPGVYGYQRMCEYARRSYPNVGQHLAQTYGTKTVALDLWQHEQVDICGVAVDLNECTVEGWKKDLTPEEAKAIAQQVLVDAGLDPNTIEVWKKLSNKHIHAIVPNENQTTGPLVPPVDGAKYAGKSADGSQVLWLYPGETTPRA